MSIVRIVPLVTSFWDPSALFPALWNCSYIKMTRTSHHSPSATVASAVLPQNLSNLPLWLIFLKQNFLTNHLGIYFKISLYFSLWSNIWNQSYVLECLGAVNACHSPMTQNPIWHLWGTEPIAWPHYLMTVNRNCCTVQRPVQYIWHLDHYKNNFTGTLILFLSQQAEKQG